MKYKHGDLYFGSAGGQPNAGLWIILRDGLNDKWVASCLVWKEEAYFGNLFEINESNFAKGCTYIGNLPEIILKDRHGKA